MVCPYCKEAKLKVIDADPPWTIEHYQCPKCDSTFNIDEVKEKEDGRKEKL